MTGDCLEGSLSRKVRIHASQLVSFYTERLFWIHADKFVPDICGSFLGYSFVFPYGGLIGCK